MKRKIFEYVIGVDGGGSKTVAALADLNGKILAMAKTGSASPRNVGFKKAMVNVAKAIETVLKQRKEKIKIASAFLGLPCLEEEFKYKKEKIKKELLKYKKISPIFRGKVIIGSDQLSGFRSGTDKKDGILLNAGSGQVVHGWSGKKEVKISGWGYLTEKGCAFWVGLRGLEAILKELDGSGSKTLMKNLVFRKFKIKNQEDLLKKVYSPKQISVLQSFSVLVDKASQKEDRIAKKIMIEAGEKLTEEAKSAIKKLNFQRKKFPLVLIGSMFKSKIILEETKKEIRKFTPRVEFIQPTVEPVIGAIKLANENIKNSPKKFFKNH